MTKRMPIKRIKSNKVNSQQVVPRDRVVYTNPRCPLPTSYVCTMRCTQTGSIPVGTIWTNGGAFFTVLANGYVPFTTAALMTAAVNPGPAVALSNTSNLASNLAGYNEFARLYANYRIVKSKFKITLYPANANDVIQMCVSCVPGTSLQTTFLSPEAVQGQNGIIQRVIQFSDNKDHTITSTNLPWNVLGLTKAQYDDQPPVQSGSQPSGTVDYNYIINLFNLVSTTLAGNVGISCELEADVELSQVLYTNLES